MSVALPSPDMNAGVMANAWGGKSNARCASKCMNPAATIHATVASMPIHSTTVNRPTDWMPR